MDFLKNLLKNSLLKCSFWKIDGRLASLYQKDLPKIGPLWAEWANQDYLSLHQIKGLTKKFLFPAQYGRFLLIFGKTFWYSDAN